MKTKLISTLKKELLIIEAKNESIAWAMIFNEWVSKEVLKWTILGKPDEIKEEDAKELVKTGSYTTTFWNYKTNDTHKSNQLRTAKESLFSALESEIYWENPEPKLSDLEYFLPSINEGIKLQKRFDKAQEKTFDKNRTLIFFKN